MLYTRLKDWLGVQGMCDGCGVKATFICCDPKYASVQLCAECVDTHAEHCVIRNGFAFGGGMIIGIDQTDVVYE